VTIRRQAGRRSWLSADASSPQRLLLASRFAPLRPPKARWPVPTPSMIPSPADVSRRHILCDPECTNSTSILSRGGHGSQLPPVGEKFVKRRPRQSPARLKPSTRPTATHAGLERRLTQRTPCARRTSTSPPTDLVDQRPAALRTRPSPTPSIAAPDSIAGPTFKHTDNTRPAFGGIRSSKKGHHRQAYGSSSAYRPAGSFHREAGRRSLSPPRVTRPPYRTLAQ